ncbi:MAG TPA: hypothetical protein ENF62_02820 [Candidatus Bathyarchaeota archaeon]|nr:hypothetical protein [Candidatus Bathyarchaeota archaeon]
MSKAKHHSPWGLVIAGILLIILGIVYLLNLPFWPTILIVIGAYLVILGALRWKIGETFEK